jgi:hypothetical protein
MSGEDDRDRSKPEDKPRAEDADVPKRTRLHAVPSLGLGGEMPRRKRTSPEPWPTLRPRRVKPPPGIISAGGVDMARAHASGITPRVSTMPEPPVNEPRVVLTVETNPQRALTQPRLQLSKAGTSDASSAHDGPLPGSASDAAAPPPPADMRPFIDDDLIVPGDSIHPEGKRLPIVVRLVCLAMSLALFVGVVARARMHGRVPPAAPAAPQAIRLLEPLQVPANPASPPSLSPAPTLAEPVPTAPAPTAPGAPLVKVRRAKPAPASSSSKPAFAPPFLLPGEKN